MRNDNNEAVRKLLAAMIGKKRLPRHLEIDHIIPRWAGGTDHLGNLQVLRRPDHQRKTEAENRLRRELIRLALLRKLGK